MSTYVGSKADGAQRLDNIQSLADPATVISGDKVDMFSSKSNVAEKLLKPKAI